jgi:mono/diheme cytochrome c family protein
MSVRLVRGLRLMAALMVAGSASAAAAQATDAAPERGRALFNGSQALVGKIALHPDNLPPEVLRCANCHDAAGSPPVLRTVAPALTRTWLIAPRERRGGPLTRYDAAAFCRLLQTGQDPANLIVNVQMPRYTLSEQDCDALWRHLVGPDHE